MNGSPHLTERRFSLRSLQYHWRINVSVLLGVMAGTAVVTGALVVGDSVRHSLRRLTLERLGMIDEIILADRFFSAEIASGLQLAERPIEGYSRAMPAILLDQVTVQSSTTHGIQRTGQVTLIGSDAEFWDLSDDQIAPSTMPTDRQIVLNQRLADDLGVHMGDRIVVRLPQMTHIPGDSPLGNKSDRIRNLPDMEVVDVVPSTGLGRFSLRANQTSPRTAFVDAAVLQRALDQVGKVNAILVAGHVADQAPSNESRAELRQRIQPTLDDAGLSLKTISLRYWPDGSTNPRQRFQYVSLSTDSLMFSPAAGDAIARSLSGLEFQTVLTYLANSIRNLNDPRTDAAVIPYSTVTALGDNRALTPLVTREGTAIEPLRDDEIVLNGWAADQLKASVGDRIRISYFAPETTHGNTTEKTSEFTLREVVPLQAPTSPFRRNREARFTEPPFRTNDPDLTPEVPGITDEESIDAWDPPFPFDYRRIRQPEDEDYWDNYRTTPKAFISQQAGDEIWGSRFGRMTSFRIEGGDDASFDEIQRRVTTAISNDLEAFGVSMLDVKRVGLKASQGTTPFNLLFLGFSFFIMAAAVMLVCLMFRLSLEQRSDSAGLLLSLGLNIRQVARLFLWEGSAIAAAGGVLGMMLGIVYAALMIAGLRTWWLDAVVTPFLQLHVTLMSVMLGGLIGTAISLATIIATVAAFRKVSLQDLLSHRFERSIPGTRRRRRLRSWSAAGLWIIAVGASVSAVFLGGEAQAGAFFASGACVLVAILLHISTWFTRPIAVTNLKRHGFTLSKMVIRNVGRNAGRSTLTLGIMATACFLIVAISAFRLQPTRQGTGGFQLIAESDVTLFDDLNDADVRADTLGSEADRLTGTVILPFRLFQGDDASCRNLYQAQRPRILGVTPTFIQWMNREDGPRFSWAGTTARNAEQSANPWQLLTTRPSTAIPVVLDKNTAMYSLHLYGGVGEEFELDYGPHGKLKFKVVGLLANSILQGSLLISEANLLSQFPNINGYSFFLIETDKAPSADVGRILEDAYRDEGFQTVDARGRLSDLLAIQNTYLSTFQSLGGFGLLLGTFGLIATQLRNVFERRAELAVLRATGFSQGRLARLVVLEHLTLLVGGLAIGVVAALIAVLPHAWTTRVRPPWTTLSAILMTILITGIVTGVLALRPVSRAPIMDALRHD